MRMHIFDIIQQDQGSAVKAEGGAVDPSGGEGDSSDESEEDEKLEVNLEAGELYNFL